ncbi:MAG TPA: ribosome-associated translation inhibitor RaiA, partial [Parachlamydiales bacterium]|nr:ribosome-associated translation inhibitor RaiA [Parachlamydiales bacterium]
MVDKRKFIEEETQGYNITVVGRNVSVTDPMKKYAWEKISKVERFGTHMMDVLLTLDIQKIEHMCQIVMKWNHFKVKVQASSSDMYASIDRAVDRLQAKLRRWKKRIQMHHHKGVPAIDLQVNVLQRPYDEVEEFNKEMEEEEEERKKEMAEALLPPKIIGHETRALKELTIQEAIMKMELSEDPFLIFHDETDRHLKVIYRREDGNFGVI